MTRKRTALLAAAGGLLAALALGAVYIGARPLGIELYLYDACGGCSAGTAPCRDCGEAQGSLKKYNALLAELGLRERVDIASQNILFPQAREAFLERLGVETLPDRIDLPMAVVGGEVLWGDGQISRELGEAVLRQDNFWEKLRQFFRAGPKKGPESEKLLDRVLSFSMDGCPDCAEADAYLDGLAEKYPGKFYQNFEVIKIGKDQPEENKEQMARVYSFYGREDALWVPTIVVNDRCLIGIQEIRGYFDSFDPSAPVETRVPLTFTWESGAAKKEAGEGLPPG